MNIGNIHNCFGCGVCAIACGHKIIDIRLNIDGFYEPFITEPTKCTDCGLCVEVCSFNHNDLSLTATSMTSYAAWSKDHAVRRKCSSGGAGFEIARKLLADGYKVCGVRYNAEKNKAEHYIATTIEELIPSIGSKYIQSFTLDGFKQINKKEKYLVTGTPCQIDSFRRYIQKFRCEDNFVLMDFFCHGVPSKLLWDKYVKLAEKEVGKLTYVSWRNKRTGWHDSWAMAIDGKEKGEPVGNYNSFNMLMRERNSYLNSRLSQGDIFYKMYLGDFCMNPACRKNCKYKYNKSSADIRIGDLWGATYKNDDDGVSALVAFTDKGNSLINKLYCHLVSHSFEVTAEGQMRLNCSKAPLAFIAKMMLHSDNNYPKWLWKVLIKSNLVFKKIKRRWSSIF